MTDPKQEQYEAVIVDERTGEEIPKGATEQVNALQIQVNANSIGTLEPDDKAMDVLDEALKPADVRIRPDGLVYLPWTWYAERLNRAFGKLGWGMIPQGGPQTKNMGKSVLVVWGFWLVIKGVPIGFAVGETSYQPDNYTMSYGDAIEGAKSIALARNCKQIGMALELWEPEWVEYWKKEFAETYKNDKGKTLWRKKGEKNSTSGVQKAQNRPQNGSGATETESPASGMVETAEALSAQLSQADLRKEDSIEQIKAASGKTLPEILKVINGLEGKHTIGQVVKLLQETK